MIIRYSSKKLERILNNERLIKKEYNSFHKNVSNRISEIRAANCLDDISNVPPPRRHKLSGNRDSCWGIDISKNFRIILSPVGNYDIYDLTSIVEVEIIALEDYH